MNTAYPGPKTREFLNSVTPYTKDADTIEYVVNYKKCKGSYLCDIDSNVVLDLNGQDGTLPLGYNDKAMVKLLKKGKLDPYQLHNPSLYMYPNVGLHTTVQTSIVAKAAPKGLEKVLFAEGPSSNAIELAVRMAILNSGNKVAGVGMLEEAVHGNENGNLVCGVLAESTTAAIYKKSGLNTPRVVLPFPEIKYPLDLNEEYNSREEAICLEQIRNILADAKPGSIAAIIVSPIQVSCCHNYYPSTIVPKLSLCVR